MDGHSGSVPPHRRVCIPAPHTPLPRRPSLGKVSVARSGFDRSFFNLKFRKPNGRQVSDRASHWFYGNSSCSDLSDGHIPGGGDNGRSTTQEQLLLRQWASCSLGQASGGRSKGAASCSTPRRNTTRCRRHPVHCCLHRERWWKSQVQSGCLRQLCGW